jgi:nicotinamidase-related amidase
MRRRVAGLASLAQEGAVPTIFAAVEPDNRGPIIPELTKLCPDAPVVVRSAANAWDTGLREAVASTGRSALVIVGSATELAVPLCALAAAEDGYDVYVLLDAPGLASETTRRLRDRVIVTSFSVVMEALG